MAKNQNNPNNPQGAQTPKNQPIKYDINLIPDSVQVDQKTGTYKLSIECLVTVNNIAIAGKIIQVKIGIAVKQNLTTDANGLAIYKTKGNLDDEDQNISFRFCLAGSADEKTTSVTIPKIEAIQQTKTISTDKDPESLTIYRHRDKQGNFSVLVRILKAGGAGISTPFTVWYKGNRFDYKTDRIGVFDFKVTPPVRRGEDENLQVFASSGIAEGAKIRIHRPIIKANYKKTPHWLIKTNNGRALIFSGVTVLFWLIIFLSLSSPIISPNLFRDQKTGLSAAESFYNESVRMADSLSATAITPKMIQPQEDMPSLIPSNIWIFGLVFTVFASIYFLLAWREEVMAGIESGLERIVDKNSDKANDPTIERWMKHFGMMHRVGGNKMKMITTTAPAPATAIAPAPSPSSEHPSISTLFTLDLVSDTLVEIVPAILKKIFGK
jgi:hypothetical protein